MYAKAEGWCTNRLHRLWKAVLGMLFWVKAVILHMKMLEFQVPVNFQLFSIDCQMKPITLQQYFFSISIVWNRTSSRQSMKSLLAVSTFTNAATSARFRKLSRSCSSWSREIVARRQWKSMKTHICDKSFRAQTRYGPWGGRSDWSGETMKLLNDFVLQWLHLNILCCDVRTSRPRSRLYPFMCSCGSFCRALGCRTKSQVQALARKE